MAILRRFIDANKRLSRRIGAWLPRERDMMEEFEHAVAREFGARSDLLVLDVGGGKQSPVVRYLRGPSQRVLGIDISADELVVNHDLQHKLVADITQTIPLADNSVDVVTSRSVLEHLRGNERFFSEAFRVLRPGGVMIHTFPCKFAPFALINQALPNAVSKRVLYFFIEEARGYSGFPAYYEKCYPSAVRRLVKETGFEEEELAISFSQSAYFSVMTPAYLLSRAYEALVQAIGADNLCAFILLRARKTAAPDESRNGSRNRIAASPPFIGAG